MQSQSYLDSLIQNKTNYAEEQAKNMDDIDTVIRFLYDDFPIRTVKEELEREIELRADELEVTHEEVIKVLKKKCGDVNVSNWLGGKAKAFTKDSAIKIAFAMQMSASKASWFLKQSCGLDGLYMRDIKDVIYSFCLNAKMEYSLAEDLIEKYKGEVNNPNPDPVVSEVIGERITTFLEKSVVKASTINELDDFIIRNLAYFGTFRRKSYECFRELYDEICKTEKSFNVIREGTVSAEEPNIEEIFEQISMKIPSLRGRKSIISDVLKKIAEDAISRTTISEIVNKNALRAGKKITEVKRKHLLLMWLWVKSGTPDFFEYPNIQTAFDECVRVINDDLLEPCGMPRLDPRNPFDWIILNALNYAYFSGTDEEDEEDDIDTIERIKAIMERLFSGSDEL